MGYWDADLATPLAAIRTFCSILDFRPDIDMVFGARVCLHGRAVTRKPIRHYLGRAFATAASLALGVHFYDTQCGAKLFRATPEVKAFFEKPFRSRWIFDVEIVARAIAARRGTGRPAIEQAIYEFPLHEWNDVAGSKLRPVQLAEGGLRTCGHPLDLWGESRQAARSGRRRATLGKTSCRRDVDLDVHHDHPLNFIPVNS